MRDSPVVSEAAPTETAGESTVERIVAPELAVGDVVGRYVVVSRLGAGGMGVVHGAYDPQLDRKVALERALALRQRGDGAPTDLAETQFLLARAVDESGGPPARARAFADAALDVDQRAEGDHAASIARLRDWLRSHRARG